MYQLCFVVYLHRYTEKYTNSLEKQKMKHNKGRLIDLIKPREANEFKLQC